MTYSYYMVRGLVFPLLQDALLEALKEAEEHRVGCVYGVTADGHKVLLYSLVRET